MASLATVSLQEPIIPLISSFKVDDLALTKIEHRWTEKSTAREGKMCLPMCPDGQNKELLLYVVDQFLDCCDASRLNITTGPDLYSKFRCVLNGDLRHRFVFPADLGSRSTQKSLYWWFDRLKD